MTSLVLSINGREHAVDADPATPLLFVLRNHLGLTAAKFGCGLEQCYACAVLVDGEAVPSCVTPAGTFAGSVIRTVEGLGSGSGLHRVQQAFVDEEAAQCGYCIPGMIIGAVALLERTPTPDATEIREALDPHLCRCGVQPRIVKAVRRAAQP
jgi:nicotinate dehydrogenase subunit A